MWIEGIFDGFSRRGVIIGFCGEVDDWIGRGGLGLVDKMSKN